MYLNNVPFGSTYNGAMSLSATVTFSSTTTFYIGTSGTGLAATSTEPTTFAELIELTVPNYADIFGVQINTAYVSGTRPASWTKCRVEAWALGDGMSTSDLTPTVQPATLLRGAPFLFADNVGGSTTACSNRRAIDVSGATPDLAWTEFLLGTTGQTAINRAVSIFFSPFPSASPPLIGHYRKIYLAVSFTPNAANTSVHTLTFRPLAGGMGTRLS